AKVDVRIIGKDQAELPLDIGSDGQELIIIGRGHHALQLELDAALTEQIDPAQAAFEGGPVGHRLVGVWRDPVEGDFDPGRRIRGQEVGHIRGNGRAVAEDRQQEPLLLHITIDIAEMRMEKNLAPGQEHPQATSFNDLIGDPTDFFVGQLPRPGGAVMRWQIHPTVGTGQVAAVGQLHTPLQGDPGPLVAMLNPPNQLMIADGRYRHYCHTWSPSGGDRSSPTVTTASICSSWQSKSAKSASAVTAVTSNSATSKSRMASTVRWPSSSSQTRAAT